MHKVADGQTPKIRSLDPEIALPQSLLTINGDIKVWNTIIYYYWNLFYFI